MTALTRKTEEDFLCKDIAENPLFQSSFDYSDVISSFNLGNLPLVINRMDGIEIVDESSINEIYKVVPYILKIAEKPRSFIRTYEDKVPIETAKSINHKAISMLSRDSNDWYARTYLTVKPKNIVADVSEETFNTYENRFICTLVDRIQKLILQERVTTRLELDEVDELTMVYAKDRYFGLGSSSMSALDYKIINMNSKEPTEYQINLEKKLEKLNKILKWISFIKNSEMYKDLRKMRVSNPIQRTNILIFDYFYNQAYRLWNYLDEKHMEVIRKIKPIKASQDELDNHYCLYNFLCLCVCFNDLGFIEKSGVKLDYGVNGLTSQGDLLFERARDKIVIRCNLTDNGINFKLLLEKIDKNIPIHGKSGKKTKSFSVEERWDKFRIVPLYTDLEKLDSSGVEDFSEYILNSKSGDDSDIIQYYTVSLNVARFCADGDILPDRIIRRFHSLGDNFSPDESSENLEKWNDYQTGIAIVSPISWNHIRTNLGRILNIHIMKKLFEDYNRTKVLEVCPCCGNKLEKDRHEGFRCNYCKHWFSKTYCNSCDQQHLHPIPWVKYYNNDFLKDDVIRERLHGEIDTRLTQVENLMTEFATTSFDIKDGKLKTICPRCGIQLGDESTDDSERDE